MLNFNKLKLLCLITALAASKFYTYTADISSLQTEADRQLSTISRQNLSYPKYGALNNYAAFIASRYFDSLEDHINFSMTCKKFLCNMDKFFYNPVPLTIDNRDCFSYLRTLYIYMICKEMICF